jgi:hypothetical protein
MAEPIFPEAPITAIVCFVLILFCFYNTKLRLPYAPLQRKKARNTVDKYQ